MSELVNRCKVETDRERKRETKRRIQNERGRGEEKEMYLLKKCGVRKWVLRNGTTKRTHVYVRVVLIV